MSIARQFRSADDKKVAEFLKELQWTPEQVKGFISAGEKPPVMTMAGRGRKPSPNSKKMLTLRLDQDVIEHFRASGEGWQTRMNEALRKAAGL